MSDRYILDERGEPKLEPCIITWGEWMQTADRKVAHTVLPGVTISTVFLGLDHSFHDCGTPVLWETMAFCDDDKDPRNCDCDRAFSRAHALRNHIGMVARFVQGEP